MSLLKVDTITNEAGNGPPNFPNGLAVSLLAPLAGSTANALLLDLTTPVAGTQISFVPADPNTGAVTINGEPALAMKDGGSPMPAGYLLAGEITHAEWTGAAWRVRRRVFSGSNSNGQFTQWEDGAQKCWHRVTMTQNGSNNFRMNATWTYPVAFLIPPNIGANLPMVNEAAWSSISGTAGGRISARAIGGGSITTTETDTQVAAFFDSGTISASSQITNVHVNAVGRWY